MNTSTLGFHSGNVLLQVASTYDTILKVVLEQIQNALDAGAKSIEVIVNLKSGEIYVRDNGDGVSGISLSNALSLIGESRKDGGKLGQFGIGMISPLGNCLYFTFTSCPKPKERGYKTWTFKTADIRTQSGKIEIPIRDRPELTRGSVSNRNLVRCWWSTEVHMMHITEEKLLRNITMQSLIEEVNSRFGKVMQKLHTAINARIIDENGVETARTFRASTYTGAPLEELTIVNNKAGATTFRLFVVRKEGRRRTRKGVVSVGKTGDQYRFPFTKLAHNLRSELDKSVKDALRSGILEGDIECERVQLNPDRERFESNAALEGLRDALEEWFLRVGSDLIASEKDKAAETRHQELALQALSNLEEWFRDPTAVGFKDAMKQFRFGSTGNGHSPKPGKEVGEQDRPALSTKGRSGKPRPSRNGKPKNRTEPKKDRPNHTPNTVTGPNGQVRKVVRSHSLGLQITHERIRGEDKPLWELDSENGILTFNVLHQHWSRCEDKSDTALTRLQEVCMLQALTLLTLPEMWREHTKTGFEVLTGGLVLTLVQPTPHRRKKSPKN